MSTPDYLMVPMRRTTIRLLPLLALSCPWLPLIGQQSRPRLVLAIAIDQFRPDYLDRWRDQFTGGLAFLLHSGIFYPHGEQDHAITETAPGHSTMMSGRSPARTGIVTNGLGVPDASAPLLGSSATGASPRRFLGTTLLDWMLARDPNTKSLSVSRKDRGAILPMGKTRTGVFWYSQGRFTTSTYYADTLPAWLRAWNARDPVDHLKGTSWTLSRDPSSYPEPDDRPFEAGGKDRLFPHVIPADSAGAAEALPDFSVMDSLTLDVLFTGIRAMRLGKGPEVDFASVSLSSTDAVGHKWGPGSREMHDHVLNVDRWLGHFFDSLATVVPLDRVIITLTADHGGTEFPEAGAGGRLNLVPQVRALNAWSQSHGYPGLRASTEAGLIFGNFDSLGARGANVDSIATALAASIAKLPGVRRVYTPRTLAAGSRDDLDLMRWRRQLPPEFSWVVAVSANPHWIFSGSSDGTTHGTTNPDDVTVPMLFRVPGERAARIDRVVRTVDIAPTLASLLGIAPLEQVEGVALAEVVRRH
ncbi:MAG TPA: alkaline phosphatase family protein [Gemmatimonadales bacterium]|jgi:hypothetical protein